MAQIAATAFFLDNLSETHWVARGLFALSLICSLWAVSYAATQYLTMAHLLSAKQVRQWIRGGTTTIYVDPLTVIRENLAWVLSPLGLFIGPRWPIWQSTIKFYQPCEPAELTPNRLG